MISRRSTIVGGIALSATLMPKAAHACPKTVRIIVSLADNKNQGIVPIQPSLGNGQDPKNNLYWGAMYGVKSYFKRHSGYEVKRPQSDAYRQDGVLEEIEIYDTKKYVLTYADAWDGSRQKTATEFFMDLLVEPQDSLTIFVGHNPLMDESVPMPKLTNRQLEYNKAKERKFAVIACQSRRYFEDHIKSAGHVPYVLTAGNMAPEAYVVEAILRAWLEDQPAQTAREYAAKAYSKYQKIPLKNSNWLFGV